MYTEVKPSRNSAVEFYVDGDRYYITDDEAAEANTCDDPQVWVEGMVADIAFNYPHSTVEGYVVDTLTGAEYSHSRG